MTGSVEDYGALALRLARDPEELGSIRRKLVDNRSTHPMFDIPRFTRYLETAYRMMWDAHLAGDTARPITVDEAL